MSPAPRSASHANREGAKVAKRAGIVAIFTLGSRILGYARDAVLANIFGAGAVYDAFIIATTIPNFLRRLVAEGGLVVAFVPLLTEEREAGGLPAMQRFTAAVLGLLIPLLLGLSAAGMLFPDAAVALFAAGFDETRASIASDLTVIVMPYIAFVSLVALSGGVLNTFGRFAAPAAAPILLNVAIITGALGALKVYGKPVDATDANALRIAAVVGYGWLAGGALQLILQLPFLVQHQMLVRPRFEPSYPAVVKLGRRMLPAVFGIAVYQLNLLVIRQIGSFLPTGQLTWYYSSTRLQEFALGVFAVSVSVAALPTLSEHAARADWDALRRMFHRALRITNFITIPTAAGMFVVAEPIVGVLFRHGAFSAHDAQQTAQLLRILTIGLIPIGVVRVMVPTFYSLGDTITPVVAGFISLATVASTGLLLVGDHEIAGLCVAMTIAAFVQLIPLRLLLARSLRRRGAGKLPPDPSDPSVFVHGLKCALAVVPSTAVAWLSTDLHDWFGGSNLVGALYLAVTAAVAGSLYMVAAKLLRIGEMDLFWGMVRRRLLRR